MVTRYNVSSCVSMDESTSGDYVLWDHYESLAYEYDMLKDKYDLLVGKIGDLYREF